MKTNFIKDYIKCGFIGWGLECFFTGLGAVAAHKDKKLRCTSSVWMFPIYGLAAAIKPISKKLRRFNVLIRGGVYTALIFITEYCTGSILRKFKACPWDYSKTKYNYKGVVRLDYAPLWFLVGLLYEKVLSK